MEKNINNDSRKSTNTSNLNLTKQNKMKLNNAQITALADSFYNEIKAKQEEACKQHRAKQLEKFRPLFDAGHQILKDNSFLKSISIDLGKGYSEGLSKNEKFEDWVDCYNIRQVVDKPIKNININTIKQTIILATIDASSVEDIMKTLKQKYK